MEEISEQVEEISDIITIPTIQQDKIEEKNELLVEKLLEEQEKNRQLEEKLRQLEEEIQLLKTQKQAKSIKNYFGKK